MQAYISLPTQASTQQEVPCTTAPDHATGSLCAGKARVVRSVRLHLAYKFSLPPVSITVDLQVIGSFSLFRRWHGDAGFRQLNAPRPHGRFQHKGSSDVKLKTACRGCCGGVCRFHTRSGYILRAVDSHQGWKCKLLYKDCIMDPTKFLHTSSIAFWVYQKF